VWKDFQAPEHPYGILKFIKTINSEYSVQRGPLLVHCSAGVGRTGTLVALDSLMQQLNEEGQVAIFNTICDMRHQRNYLVQSLVSFSMVFSTIFSLFIDYSARNNTFSCIEPFWMSHNLATLSYATKDSLS
jgi:protein-tyrosine phosphatase